MNKSKSMNYEHNWKNTLIFLAGMLEKKEKEELLKILYDDFLERSNNPLFTYSIHDQYGLVHRCAKECGLKRGESNIVNEILKAEEEFDANNFWNVTHGWGQMGGIASLIDRSFHDPQSKWKEYLKERREARMKNKNE